MVENRQKMKTAVEIRRATWIGSTFRTSAWRLGVLVLLSFVSIGLTLLNPWPLKLLVDSVFGDIVAPGPLEAMSGSYVLLVVVALSYVVIYLVSGLLDIVDSYLTTRFSNHLSNELQKYFYNHVLNMSANVKRRLDSGDYLYRLNEEVDNLPALIFSTTPSVVSSAVMIVAALAILVLMDWQLALVGVVIVPLMYGSIRYFTPKIGEKSDEIASLTSDIYNTSNESIDNSVTVQAFNRQTYQVQAFGRLIAQRMKSILKLDVLSNKFEYANNIATSLGVAIVILFGGYKVFEGSISVGELLVFVTYMSYFYDPLQTILTSVSDYKTLMTGIRRVFEVLDEPSIDSLGSTGHTLKVSRGAIQFRKVSFQHGRHVVLDNVNLDIVAGQKIAFVGPSGSGKSTLLNLLPRFTVQNVGLIYIDGQETSGVSLNSLRDNIGYVAQMPALFSGSIRSNIGFGIPEEKLDLPDIVMAAQAANAYDFIDSFNDKFETIVGEGGENLSGGQQQRIAIARAYVKNPPILVLDEPTSALDYASSTKLIEAIQRLMSGKTVLMSTHETALLKGMDKVYVVENGKVTDVAQYGGIDEYIDQLKRHQKPTKEL